jgi:hypothetical protein
MAKQLIGVHNIDAHVRSDSKTIHIDRDMILSPGAKDILRNRGISITYGLRPSVALKEENLENKDSSAATKSDECPDAESCLLASDCAGTASGNLCLVLARAEEILTGEYGITDPKSIEAVKLNIRALLQKG